MTIARETLVRQALRIGQLDTVPLYSLTLPASEVLEIAEISRVRRDEAGDLIGYQRSEVRQHVQDIADYLDGKDPLLPNPLILALSSKVRFLSARGPSVSDGDAARGTLEIPRPGPGEPKPGWIVDGQQRALALARTRRRDFIVPVMALVTDSIELQRDQFVRVNSTRSLPTSLVTELLPEVSTDLPAKLARKKAPSAICDMLNRKEGSPFRGLIHRSSSGARNGAVIADTSIVKMVESSLFNPLGCLAPFRNATTNETDYDGVYSTLITYWSGVRDTFPDAWGKPPTRSRLMHGVGIGGMGRVMDRVMTRLPHGVATVDQVVRELQPLRAVCRWTSGAWDGLNGRAWNAVENTPKQIAELASLLERTYLGAGAAP